MKRNRAITIGDKRQGISRREVANDQIRLLNEMLRESKSGTEKARIRAKIKEVSRKL